MRVLPRPRGGAALLVLAAALAAEGEEGDEMAGMQTVARLREAACPPDAPAAPSAAEPDTEDTAVLQTRRSWAASRGAAAPAQEASARAPRYLPGVHAQAVDEAFSAALSQGGCLQGLLEDYERAGMRKTTSGSCSVNDCYAWRGKVDCLGGHCVCQEGYGTRDGETCVPRYSEPLYATDTGGTCGWLSCSSWRGPTVCQKGRCLCQAGYAAEDGKCTPVALADPAHDVVRAMLDAGVREPDEMPCPGDTFERGTMNWAIVQMATGEEHFNVSLCRTGVQIYHASPLPLVDQKALLEPPQENGRHSADNAGTRLYSVMTNRQWRTHMIQIMSTEFAYAIALPDLTEGARRLGNLFHTLGDSFSASHVLRASRHGEPSAEVCGGLSVKLAMTMDVMNFVVHPIADARSSDLLFKCNAYYTEQTIKLWAEARRQEPASAAAVNEWVGKLVAEVLCPSLRLASALLDKPAGGATAYYSANLGRRTEPKGVASEGDAGRIVGGWALGLAAERAKESPENQRSFPQNIAVPGRSLDACKDASVAHVGEQHVLAARSNQLPPQYLQPYF